MTTSFLKRTPLQGADLLLYCLVCEHDSEILSLRIVTHVINTNSKSAC
jgi:hypothetical protein